MERERDSLRLTHNIELLPCRVMMVMMERMVFQVSQESKVLLELLDRLDLPETRALL